MVKPSIGRIVHFVDGEMHLPAIITRVWSDVCVNLHVFSDAGSNLATPTPTSVCFSEQPGNYSWHWPEKV